MEVINDYHNIFDDSSSRDHIHFAQEYNGHLFTLQDDQLLKIFKIEQPFALTLVSTVSLEKTYYDPVAHFHQNQLLLTGFRKTMALINVDDIQHPTVSEMKINSIETLALSHDNMLYTQSREGFSVSEQPSKHNPTPKADMLIPEDDFMDLASHQFIVGNTLYWVGNDCFYVMDIANPQHPTLTATKKIISILSARSVLLDDDHVVLMNTGDEFGYAIQYFNIANNNIKRGGKGILKAHTIRGYDLVDNTLYIAHHHFKKIKGERRYQTVFSCVDVTGVPAVTSTHQLPYIEEYGEPDTNILWIKVVGDEAIILRGNGDVQGLSL